jgi:hypothetical protein
MSQWNHLLCEKCWNEEHPDRRAMIVTSSGPDACCRCGEKTGSGIYVRAKPDTMRCKGAGSVHDDGADR